MGFDKKYFPGTASGPAPLTAQVRRRVRFEEVDMLFMVWHGHYVSYLEDGRIAFGDKYGLSYTALREAGIAAPIVQMHLDYHAPLHFDQEFEIQAILHWCEPLRLNFEYVLMLEKTKVATGYTVQLFVDLEGNLIFTPPEFIAVFRENWRTGRCK